jgi:hypothetical protein
MTDTANPHGGDVDNEHSALRVRIRVLGAKAIADLSRCTKDGEHVSQTQIRLFRDGLAALDPRAMTGLAEAVTAVEAAASCHSNVVLFPANADKPIPAGEGGEKLADWVRGDAKLSEYDFEHENTVSAPPVDGGICRLPRPLLRPPRR